MPWARGWARRRARAEPNHVAWAARLEDLQFLEAGGSASGREEVSAAIRLAASSIREAPSASAQTSGAGGRFGGACRSVVVVRPVEGGVWRCRSRWRDWAAEQAAVHLFAQLWLIRVTGVPGRVRSTTTLAGEPLGCSVQGDAAPAGRTRSTMLSPMTVIMRSPGSGKPRGWAAVGGYAGGVLPETIEAIRISRKMC